VLYFVAKGVEHVVASLDKKPRNHQQSRALHHDFVGCEVEVADVAVVVGDTEVHRDEFPKERQGWHEEDPHQEEVTVEYVEQGVEAMGHGQLVVVGADAVSQEWIHLDVADVYLTLVIIDKVDLHFVVHRLCFVNFYDLFLLEQSARIL